MLRLAPALGATNDRQGVMREHVHTGPAAFLFAGLSAIVLIHVLRIVAAQLAERPGTEGAGKALAAFALSD